MPTTTAVGFLPLPAPGLLSASFLPASTLCPFLEQLCIIRSPLPSPSPNTPTCPFWFSASSWSVSRAKSNRCVWDWPARVIGLAVQTPPRAGLSLNWSKAGCPFSGALQGLSREAVRCLCLLTLPVFLLLLAILFFFLLEQYPFPFLIACLLFYFLSKKILPH